MDRATALVVAGVTLFALGFLTQDCVANNPVWSNTTAPKTCTSPAFPFVLLFWLPALVLVVLGAVVNRRARNGLRLL